MTRFLAFHARWVAVIGLIVIASLFAMFYYSTQDRTVRILLDMEVDKGGNAWVYINGTSDPPLAIRLEQGVRRVYAVTGRYSRIDRFRLDPTDRAQATVRIYSIAIETQQGIVHRIAPKGIQHWATNAVQSMKVNPDGSIEFMTTGENPIVDSPQDIDL